MKDEYVVRYGSSWQMYDNDQILLPEDIDPQDKDAVIEWLKGVWEDIPLPSGGSYIQDSHELDEESVVVIPVQKKDGAAPEVMPAEKPRYNTRFRYVYVDYGNNRWANEIVVRGIMDSRTAKIILACMEQNPGEDKHPKFIPEQLGLPLEHCSPECDQEPDEDLDHCWALCEDGVEAFEPTADAPTVNMTLFDLETAFLEAAHNWRPWDYGV